MTTTHLRQTLAASATAFALGGLAVGGIQFAAAQDEGRDRAARGEGPQLMRPDPGFVQQLSFADLVEDVSPAVVSVRTEREVRTSMSRLPPEFERIFPQLRGQLDGVPRRATGEGSGFFIDDEGHIVTNNHVIDGADEIMVTLYDGTELDATLVGTDPATDIAVLKVEPSSDQRYVQFAPEADLRVGDYVLAVGNPFGLGGSVTSGIVSAIGGDEARAGLYGDFIQIDASINRGNSGGPTFDLRGNVVGVNTAIISPTGGNVGIGLAVPAEVAKQVTEQIIQEGGVTRGYLGVAITSLDARLAGAVGLDRPRGALVQAVTEGGPAAEAGIEEGDVILTLNDKDIADATDLTRTVGATPPGERVRVSVLRGGEEKTLRVRLETRDDDQLAAATGTGEPREDKSLMGTLGVTFAPLTERVRERFGLDEEMSGVLVVEVDPDSEAAEAGIRSGMIVTEADNRDVRTVADIERAVEMARERDKDALLVRVVTPRGTEYRAMPVAKG